MIAVTSEGGSAQAPSLHWASHTFDDLQAAYPTDTAFAVRLNALVYAAQLTLAPHPRGLLVQLWAAPGADGPRPMLLKPEIGRGFHRHTLTISDPSLFLDPDLATGVFLGERDNDPLVGVIALARSVAESLGVSSDDIVFTGLSSGGFAAVMAACRMGAKAIAINPQLILPAIRKAPAAATLLARFQPGFDADTLGREAPLRSLAAAAYKEARRTGLSPKLAIFQNIVDMHHYEKHFIPFCAAANLGERGGVSKDRGILARTMNYADAHSAPYEIRRLAMIEAFGFFNPPSRKESRKASQLFDDARRTFGFA